MTVGKDISVMDVIARRASCRAYKPDPVPEAHIRKILEATRLAPSACNQQPWRFAVVRESERRGGFRRRALLQSAQDN